MQFLKSRNLRSAIVASLIVGGSAHGLATKPAYAQSANGTQAQTEENPVEKMYSKMEAYIPMRDGIRLYTVVFVPKDRSKTYPILLERTPYGVPYGPDRFPSTVGPSAKLSESGYLVAYQDVRGTHMSEGDFVNVRPQLPARHGPSEIDESTDCYDTVDWLVHCLPTNNGKVGLWGISYPGFYADAGAINAHPAIKAVSPQAPLTDWFLGDDEHHNGAFYLMDDFEWEFGFDFDYPRAALTEGYPQPHREFPISDAYKFYLDLGPLKNADATYLKHTVPYWNELMVHGNYDAYWKERSLLPHLVGIKPAILTTGGLFDAEDYYGTLATFKRLAAQSPQTKSYLALGPWPHGGWSHGPGNSFGGQNFGSDTGAKYRDQIEAPFFDFYLKGVGAEPTAKAQVFATGSNQWLTFDAWPPANLKPGSLALGENKSLREPGGDVADSARQDDASDSYVSDPANPVPYSAHAHTQSGRYTPYTDEDQRFLGSRPDVLTYKGEGLKSDTTIAGPVTVDLYVSTTGTDADFVVKLVDVSPDDDTAGPGAQILVRGDVMRSKFRNSFDKPEAMVPAEVTHIRFDLPDVCHTFRKDHRIAVQIQSSWFPIVDRNPQQFLDIYSANAEDFKSATIHIYRSAKYPSQIKFGAL